MRAAWWWIDRWRKSPSYTDMTLAEQGAYRNLLDELWIREGCIPNEERILGRACGDAVEWPKVRDRVMRQFYLTPQGWRNKTHDEVMGKAKGFRDAQSEKGKKGAMARWGTCPANSPAIKTANNRGTNENDPANSLPSPSPSPSPSSDPPSPFPLASLAVPVPSQASVGGIVKGGAWSREACDDWIARFGGTAPGGPIGKALKPLVDRHGWADVRLAWRNYLSASEAAYASPARFASTFGSWNGTARRGGKQTAEERTLSSLREFVDAHEGQRDDNA